jgi:hypothetical protein
MNQQALLTIRFVLTTASAILVGRGLMSQATADWIGSPEALLVIGAFGGFASLAWGWWSTRPKAVIASAGTLLEGKGAVIAPPAIADSSATPSNVVKSASEAAGLPGVRA